MEYIKHPFTVGAVVPSSRYPAKKIVELHGGTLGVSLENQRISLVMRLRQIQSRPEYILRK